jgi:hypothetical protein
MAIGIATTLVLRRCYGSAMVIPLLLHLGAKQGQGMYLAGQLLPSFLSNRQRLATTGLADLFSLACRRPTSVEAERIVGFN